MQRSKLVSTREELVAENGVATGGHQAEADAGVRMLQDGGNAVDAAVAAAFTAFAVEPSNCGLGGYDHISIYMAERQEFVSIDAYLRAPGNIRPEAYQPDLSQPFMYYGHPLTIGRVAQRGYLAAGVPGAVAGLCSAHEMFGRLPLAHVLQPAIEAAEAGLPVTMELATFIGGALNQIRELPHTAEVLLRNGDPPAAARDGAESKVDLSDMAKTLRLIAEHGSKGFYTGQVAEAIEREVAGNGGFVTAADLEAYRPKVLRESPGRYRDYDYVTANDHLSYEIMNILDHYDIASYGPGSAESYHLMGEALGHAFIDNKTHYGDPDYERSPANGIVSRAFAEERAKGIDVDSVATRPISAADPWPFEKDAEPPEVISNMPTLGKIEGTTPGGRCRPRGQHGDDHHQPVFGVRVPGAGPRNRGVPEQRNAELRSAPRSSEQDQTGKDADLRSAHSCSDEERPGGVRSVRIGRLPHSDCGAEHDGQRAGPRHERPGSG